MSQINTNLFRGVALYFVYIFHVHLEITSMSLFVTVCVVIRMSYCIM